MAASSQRSWSLPSLPLDLIEEILYRTPVESLIRAKPTCKEWYALITSTRFIYEHLRRSPQRFIRTDETVVQIMDPVTRTRSDSPLPKDLQRPYDVRAMVHCDGLMLCMRDHCQYREANLALWNPVLRQLRWIKPSRCFTRSDYYGIGYDSKKSSRYDYKILRFNDPRYENMNNHYYDEDEDEVEVEIYECKTRSWRTLDAKVDYWDVDMTCKGVSVTGNMYWYAQKYWDAEKGHRNYILGFDFSAETFKDVCFAPPSRHENFLACFDGDRLSLLQQDEDTTSPIEVWVSSKLGGDDDAGGGVLFSKYFSVSSPDLPALLFHTDMARPVYCIGKNKRIMAWCEGDVYEGDDEIPPTCIILYEIDEGGVRRQLETERHYGYGYIGTFICGYVYVPSLVSLPV